MSSEGSCVVFFMVDGALFCTRCAGDKHLNLHNARGAASTAVTGYWAWPERTKSHLREHALVHELPPDTACDRDQLARFVDELEVRAIREAERREQQLDAV